MNISTLYYVSLLVSGDIGFLGTWLMFHVVAYLCPVHVIKINYF